MAVCVSPRFGLFPAVLNCRGVCAFFGLIVLSHGAAEVMAATMDRLLSNVIGFELLPERWDIDTLEDIRRHAPELLRDLPG